MDVDVDVHVASIVNVSVVVSTDVFLVSNEVLPVSRAFLERCCNVDFSAQEATTACAFTSRAQKMPLVTRRLGACALDRGDVNCSVRVKIFCAGRRCSSILKPRADNVSNHAQPWHAYGPHVCVRAPQKSPSLLIHLLLFMRTWCQESCWFDCSCGAHIFSRVSEIVEFASISLAA